MTGAIFCSSGPTPLRHPREGGDPCHRATGVRSGFLAYPVGRPAPNASADFVEKILPLGIHALDEPKLPGSVPLLELLLAQDGRIHRLVHLVINETMDPIFFGESVDETLPVYANAFEELARDTDVKRAVAAAGEDVNAGDLAHLALSDHGPCARG